MQQIGWFAIAWVGGSLAILGSLMTIGSLLLWLVPAPAHQLKKVDDSATAPGWQSHLKLLGVSISFAIAGFSLLLIFPLPLH